MKNQGSILLGAKEQPCALVLAHRNGHTLQIKHKLNTPIQKHNEYIGNIYTHTLLHTE